MRFSLGLKFGLFLAGFAVVLGTLILTGFGTARQVATELNQVTNQALPRYSAASSLSGRFEQISRLFEDAITLGETDLLERADQQRKLFVESLSGLDSTGVPAQEVSKLRADFESYYTLERRQALQQEQESPAPRAAGRSGPGPRAERRGAGTAS